MRVCWLPTVFNLAAYVCGPEGGDEGGVGGEEGGVGGEVGGKGDENWRGRLGEELRHAKRVKGVAEACRSKRERERERETCRSKRERERERSS